MHFKTKRSLLGISSIGIFVLGIFSIQYIQRQSEQIKSMPSLDTLSAQTKTMSKQAISLSHQLLELKTKATATIETNQHANQKLKQLQGEEMSLQAEEKHLKTH
jgi:hypothetical protein